ncbi:MAG: GMC oxidoreductase, partial [Gemmatimonadota bacterium]
VYLGRSRVALLTRALGERKACTHLGRCLMGCPREALYAPSYTLGDLQRFPSFTYVPGVFVERIDVDGNGRAVGAIARSVTDGSERIFAGDRVVLAAGAIATTRIYLSTVHHATGTAPELYGLMDNRHVTMPFLTPALIGRDVNLASYQFHHIALGIRGDTPQGDVHGQITALKAAQVHPIISTLPFDFRTSLKIFRRLRAALGVVNFWIGDTRRTANVARLVVNTDGTQHLALSYGDDEADRDRTREAIDTVRRALGTLGSIAPSRQTVVLPRGSSVHYAGTLPMSRDEQLHSCRPDGSLRGIDGLFVVDGAAFTSLPAKNLTFTLMANAVRIASLSQ